MTSIIKLQVFSGAKDEGPLCYLLQVDGDYILLDCGWDERFDTKYFEDLKPFIPKVGKFIQKSEKYPQSSIFRSALS